MKNFKTTWIFAVFVAVIGGFAVYEYKKGETDELEKVPLFALGESTSSDIKELAVTYKESHFSLLKPEKGWQLSEPVQDSADEFMVQSLIEAFLAKDYTPVAEGSDIDWKVYGLDQPAGTITMTTKAGVTAIVEIGAIEAFDGRLYARAKGGHRLYTVAEVWKPNLQKPIKELREKRLMRWAPAEASRLKIKDKVAKVEFELVRTEGEKWEIKPNLGWPVDGAAVKDYFDVIYGLKASDFVDQDTSKTNPTFELEIEFPSKGNAEEKNSIWRLAIGDRNPGLMSVRVDAENPTFRVFDNILLPLYKKAEDFRDKKFPFQFDLDKVDQLLVTSSLFQSKFEKKDREWRLVDQEKSPDKVADSAEVKGLVEKLRALEASEFLKPNQKIKSVKGQISLLDKAGQEVLNLKWGDPQQKSTADKKKAEYFVMQSSLSQAPLLVPADRLNSLPMQTLLKQLNQNKKIEEPSQDGVQKAKNQDG